MFIRSNNVEELESAIAECVSLHIPSLLLKSDLLSLFANTYYTLRLWPIKICLLLIPTIGAFYLPVSTFYNYWIAALVFSCIFIVIQSMLLVELSHATAENWLSQFENGSSSHQVGYSHTFGYSGKDMLLNAG